MLSLLAPVLAQLVTLNVGDRTEARYISGDDTRLEGATRPLAGLTFGWKRSSLTLAYTPSVTVTPLERTPRNVLVFQGASLSGSYRWRLTTLTVSEFVGYGELNFRVQALADPGVNLAVTPPATGATPPVPGQAPAPGTTTGGNAPANPNTGATNQLRLQNQVIHYFTWTSSLGVTHMLSRQASIGGDAAYSEGRGVGVSTDQYPLIRGARFGAYASHSTNVGRLDTLGSTLYAQYALSSTGNKVAALQAGEVWTHRLDPRTATRLGAGLAGTRLSQDDGTIAYSVYPTFIAGINHFDRLAGGIVTTAFSASATPYLDPLRGTVDPRLAIASSVAWVKRRFAIGASAGAAISLTGNDSRGAVNSVGATLVSSYQLGAGFTVDGGFGTGWQTFEGTTIIPTSWTAFLGITFGAAVPLNNRTAH